MSAVEKLVTSCTAFTTEELSTGTWPDFEHLFSQGGGWDFCACMLNPRGCHLPSATFRTRAEQRGRNHREMRELVGQGRAHGILVYAGAEPVGWCQYGRAAELPLPDLADPSWRVARGAIDPTSQWRITCFVTHKRYRRQGVSGAALASAVESIRPLRHRFLTPLGLVGGFLDATGGGGRGPVGTPALLASGRMEPRKVIGSIDTSEFLVAVAASIGFIVGIGNEGVNYAWVGVLLLGGLVAAPIAAWLVRHVPPRVLGSAVGGLIILTNTRTLLRSDWIAAPGALQWTAYALIAAVWAAAVTHSIRRHLAEREISEPTPDRAGKPADGTETTPDSA